MTQGRMAGTRAVWSHSASFRRADSSVISGAVNAAPPSLPAEPNATYVGVRRAGLGIQSLQAALHLAGARTALTSLWKVDDQLTRELMQAFYTNLWTKGMTKGDALWQAKCALARRATRSPRGVHGC